MEAANGDLLVGGGFASIGGVPANGIARRVGGTFTALGSGVSGGFPVGSVFAIVEMPNGDIIVGGHFTSAGGVAANNVARFSGGTWSSFGDANFGRVNDLLLMADGDIIAGGQFTSIGGVATSNIGRFDSATSTWNAMGSAFGGVSGFGPEVRALALLTTPQGPRVIVVGAAAIMQWDPATNGWSTIGPIGALGGTTNGTMHEVAVWNGNLVIGGRFDTVAGTPPGVAVPARNVAMLLGSAWVQLGPIGLGGAGDEIHDLTAHPNGDLIASGLVSVGAPPTTGIVSRFNGSAWGPVGGVSALNGGVTGLGVVGEDIALGGWFTSGGGVPSPNFALFDACPAIATPYGSGCNTTLGPLVLTADKLPWVGQTFSATAINVPANAVAFGVWGVPAINVPMNLALPAGPSCAFLADADVVFTLPPPSAGNVISTFPGIGPIGASVFHQVVTLEFNGAGVNTNSSGSNGLAVTVGGL